MNYTEALSKIDAWVETQRLQNPEYTDRLKDVYVLASLKSLLAGVIENNPDAIARFKLFTDR